MSLDDRPDVDDLRRRLAETEATLEALLSNQIDAVVDAASETPILLAKAQADLRESEQRIRQVFEMAPVGIFRVEPQGQLSMVNAAMRAMLGYTEEEFLSLPSVYVLIHPEEHAAAALSHESMAAPGVPRSYSTERRLLHKDGTTVSTNIAVSLCTDDNGQTLFTIAVVVDISEHVRLENQLRLAQKLESMGRLASGIAHELNTPIQFIGDNATFLQSAYGDLIKLCDVYHQSFEAVAHLLPDAERNAVAEAEDDADLPYLRDFAMPAFAATLEGVERVSKIVKAMKAFAHPDQERKSSADINAALRSTLIIAANELKYVADVEVALGDIPPIDCYLGDLNQVFLNLFVNAAHAIGDVVATSGAKGTIRVATFRDADELVVSIGDTGTGIPEAIQQKVFDQFFTTKEVGRGTGQGLSLARTLVAKGGGTLTFDTEIGRGTTFFIRLPIAPSAQLAPDDP